MDQNINISSRAGSRWLAGMGIALAVAGGLFVVMLWTAWQRAEETRRWTATPAKVLSSQLRPVQATPNSPTKFAIQVRYEYVWQGQRHVSERIRRVNSPKGNHDDAEALREEYTPGQMITCYVKPDEPTFAILKHESRAALYSMWFPLLFVGGGLRMAWAALRQKT